MKDFAWNPKYSVQLRFVEASCAQLLLELVNLLALLCPSIFLPATGINVRRKPLSLFYVGVQQGLAMKTPPSNLALSKRSSVLSRYLRHLRKRAAGEIMTTAAWIRHFVTSHPSYGKDSVVTDEIAYDLVVACHEIGAVRGWAEPYEPSKCTVSGGRRVNSLVFVGLNVVDNATLRKEGEGIGTPDVRQIARFQEAGEVLYFSMLGVRIFQRGECRR